MFYGFEPEEAEQITDRTTFLDAFGGFAKQYEAEWKAGRPFHDMPVAINSREAQSSAPEKNLERVGAKLYLTLVSEDVQDWEDLRCRLNLATKTPGSRAALARQFKVSTAAVSQWLSGVTAPAADTALRLAQWIRELGVPHQQKKRAGSAQTQPARKTQKANPHHEKAKSNPKKL